MEIILVLQNTGAICDVILL